MAQAKKDDSVLVHYTGKLKDGNIFDSSKDREPLEFTIGTQTVIPGFEEGVIGMEVGDKKTIDIPCDQAYGQKRDDMIVAMPKDQFPDDIDPQEGMMLELQTEQGDVMPVNITEVKDDVVTLDGNHALAGQDLIFELELVEIK